MKRARRQSVARLYPVPVASGDWPDRFPAATDCILSVDGWEAGVIWIEAWARRGGWIVLDRSAHPEVRRGMDSDTRQVLWCEPSDALDVWAMLAELRARSEMQRILIVRHVPQRAVLGSTEITALARLCRDYRATLVVVVQAP